MNVEIRLGEDALRLLTNEEIREFKDHARKLSEIVKERAEAETEQKEA